MRTAALIVAGGEGKRFGSPLPKQFLKLAGKEIFIRSVEIFRHSASISKIVLVMHPNWLEKAVKILSDLGLKDVEVVPGGSNRQRSVYNGLVALRKYNPEVVMIHDAARPLFDKGQIVEILGLIKRGTGVVVAEKLVDTLYFVENNYVIDIPDRTKLWKAQTPQCFIFEEILEAHTRAKEDSLNNATDDASLYMKYVGRIKLIDSNSPNFKITSPSDLHLAECYLKSVNQ
ncbi:2-C-methyl-D-erythritol 4-phosphate cytidylyltransferase [Kosmotoga pacifica]|uniref:2-C-methyl-D-erythritol 4-phosphate cytidylyltransferase n=1 Tax=Kosmotoga pacifica TaxID=1330330 RepID=A0A0G2ZB87_9BACT|nr:2-C-methyl-D-erythritol 4-phosphate cytidylyltransferase [Kosmotoga pacifica]AKI96834.1 hypothetical protein IX53_02245 [Kosmotoga pacifica]